jgi:hypothetical protein
MLLERLTKDPKSVSVFLLLSMLSIAARLTTCLHRRYGDPVKATDYFIDRACDILHNEMYDPTIERIQAFFLLGVSEWVQGSRNRSAVSVPFGDLYPSR